MQAWIWIILSVAFFVELAGAWFMTVDSLDAAGYHPAICATGPSILAISLIFGFVAGVDDKWEECIHGALFALAAVAVVSIGVLLLLGVGAIGFYVSWWITGVLVAATVSLGIWANITN